MKDTPRYRLVGLHNAVGNRPAFLTPVLGTSPVEKPYYIHRLSENGRIEGFEQSSIINDELEGVRDDGPWFTVGDEPWWAFAFPGEDGYVQGTEGEIRQQLAGRVDDPHLMDAEFVRLEVVSLLDDRQRLPDALRTVFDSLSRRSPRGARMWRDNSILLEAARRALRALLPPERRSRAFIDAVHDTEMEVVGDTPRLLMVQSLYAYCLSRSVDLRTELEEADFLAGAFGLKPVVPESKGGEADDVMELPEPAQAPEPIPEPVPEPALLPASAKPRRAGKSLLAQLRSLVTELEDDIRKRLDDDADLNAPLDSEWREARGAGRTAAAFGEWREGEITQAAVHWVLSAVFVRFLEDNRLVDGRPWLSGPTAPRRDAARERQQAFIRENPSLSDRDYLLAAFAEVADLPGMGPLFDRRHNPIWRLQPTGDGAEALIGFFRKVDPQTGATLFDFTRADLDTRFLGDLYQDLSVATQKKYALLQTPDFVEDFILDRTLEPAVDEFGLKGFRVIDPTCGSGHFLLGAFRRIFERWRREEPNAPTRDLAQRALGAVYGVDINPFAIAIARFRLLVAALAACGIRGMKDAPAFDLNLAVGDSLLHGRHFGHLNLPMELPDSDRAKVLRHVYHAEDADELSRILGQQYHAVVGNPPYITVKDKALNQAYREHFASCHRAYALSVPFIERFFDLALDGRIQSPSPLRGEGRGEGGSAGTLPLLDSIVSQKPRGLAAKLLLGNEEETNPSSRHSRESGNPFHTAGHVGLIVSNSFMKREFGKKLIEEVLPKLDLTDIVDTSGAYIPGHGTPTCILYGRNRAPVGETIRALLGKKGEPGRPEDPAKGLVWTAILDQIDRAPSESDFITAATFPRTAYAKHPWSIGGGGAIELKEQMEQVATRRLMDVVADIGFGAVTREDEVFFIGRAAAVRKGIGSQFIRPVINGENIRDYYTFDVDGGIWPYDENTLEACPDNAICRHLWAYRTQLKARVAYGASQIERGLAWFEYSMFFRDRYASVEPMCFSFVATHNHFCTIWDNAIYNRTAPVIVVRQPVGEGVRRNLLGVLNSSIACFWMKQMFQNRGSTIDEFRARQRTAPFEDFFEFTVSGVGNFPLPAHYYPELADKIDSMMKENFFYFRGGANEVADNIFNHSEYAKDNFDRTLRLSISFQEEVDWTYYGAYRVCPTVVVSNSPPPIRLGERAFEIVMARKMRDENFKTTWFERHGSTPITELPEHWPEGYKRIVERRIELIETNRFINLVERPEYKRRWAMEPWEKMEERALKSWLLDRLEDGRYWSHGDIITIARLADMVLDDKDFLQVAELYRKRSDVDIPALVADLVTPESVPHLPILRYTESGMRKREQWEQTWALQRKEDAGEEIGPIPLPPKYKSADFQRADYWRLRGGLDVAKERFISYPGASKDSDGTLAIAWAGWDHLKQAQAMSAHHLMLKDQEGWTADRLAPLLAGLLDLVPWLKQWHNDLDPTHNTRMGDYFADFVTSEARDLGLTLDDLRRWTPPRTGKGRGRKTT